MEAATFGTFGGLTYEHRLQRSTYLVQLRSIIFDSCQSNQVQSRSQIVGISELVFACDSFYEYLLKVWVLGNKTEVVKHYR